MLIVSHSVGDHASRIPLAVPFVTDVAHVTL
jgi:hypothetical protein